MANFIKCSVLLYYKEHELQINMEPDTLFLPKIMQHIRINTEIEIAFLLLVIASQSISAFELNVDTIILQCDSYKVEQLIVSVSNTENEPLWIWLDNNDYSQDERMAIKSYLMKRGYKFVYDDANRLTQANYGEGDAIASFNKFWESVQYDVHGNITKITRNGKCSANSYGLMDNLTLSYDGNQLTEVSETANDYDFTGSFEYKKSKGSQYIYNKNGSLVADKSRGIAYITYDFNNNPQTIYFTNGYMTKYTYSALGDKLSVEHFIAQPNVTWAFGVQPDVSQSQPIFAGHTDYLVGGRLIVKEDIIKKLFFDGGYVDATALSNPKTYGFTPYYYNKDHLGNNREVVDRSSNVQQLTNYYPFGAPYADPAAVIGSTIQPYKYNGKELDTMHGLNTYDYGARQYYSILGRWDRMDPLCEKYYDVSPYVYCGNTPVSRIDIDGNDWFQQNGTQNYYWFEQTEDIEGYSHIGGIGSVLGEYESIIDDMMKEKFSKQSIYSNGFSFQIANQDKGALLGSQNNQWDIFDEFIWGTGPMMTVFLSNHPYTQAIMSDDFVKEKQETYSSGYIKEGRKWGIFDVLSTPSFVKQFIGSYTYYANTGEKDTSFLYNVIGDGKSCTSLFYHAPFISNHSRESCKYLGNAYQFYLWKSRIK